MRLTLILVLLLMTISTWSEGCKARVVRSADKVPDSRTCLTTSEYKTRKAQIYRCQLRLQMAGFTDRAKINTCLELGCDLQPSEPGMASATTASTTLILMTTIWTLHLWYNNLGILFLGILAAPSAEAIGMEQLEARLEVGQDTEELELDETEEKIRAVNETLMINLAKLNKTEEKIKNFNETMVKLQTTISRLEDMMEATDSTLAEYMERIKANEGSGVEADNNTSTLDTNTTMDDISLAWL